MNIIEIDEKISLLRRYGRNAGDISILNEQDLHKELNKYSRKPTADEPNTDFFQIHHNYIMHSDNEYVNGEFLNSELLGMLANYKAVKMKNIDCLLDYRKRYIDQPYVLYLYHWLLDTGDSSYIALAQQIENDHFFNLQVLK